MVGTTGAGGTVPPAMFAPRDKGPTSGTGAGVGAFRFPFMTPTGAPTMEPTTASFTTCPTTPAHGSVLNPALFIASFCAYWPCPPCSPSGPASSSPPITPRRIAPCAVSALTPLRAMPDTKRSAPVSESSTPSAPPSACCGAFAALYSDACTASACACSSVMPSCLAFCNTAS